MFLSRSRRSRLATAADPASLRQPEQAVQRRHIGSGRRLVLGVPGPRSGTPSRQPFRLGLSILHAASWRLYSPAGLERRLRRRALFRAGALPDRTSAGGSPTVRVAAESLYAERTRRSLGGARSRLDTPVNMNWVHPRA